MTPSDFYRIPKGANLEPIAETLHVLAVPIGLLTQHPDNPRLHPQKNLEAIGASLRKYRQRKPVVCNIDGDTLRLEAGHGVYLQMLEAGAQYIACTIVEDTAVDELGYLLADNRTGDLSEDDPAVVARLLERIAGEGEEVDVPGYEPDEVKALLKAAEGGSEEGTGGDDEPPPVDRAEALREEWQTEEGQVWEIPSLTVPGRCHRVVCGDSTLEETYRSACGSETPWLMVTDPPYGVEYDPGWRVDTAHQQGQIAGTKSVQVGLVQNDHRADWSAAYGHFGGDVAYVWCASLKLATVQADLEACDFEPRSQIIWNKPHFTISRGDYHWKHEPCWYAVRKGKPSYRTDDRTQTTIWDIASLGAFGKSHDEADVASGHGTQKPIEAMARPIRNHDFPEGTCVYDPFLGSGTTLIAAEREGRICVGCELSLGYVATILERCKTAGLEPRLVS